jgi:hypothetical protein
MIYHFRNFYSKSMPAWTLLPFNVLITPEGRWAIIDPIYVEFATANVCSSQFFWRIRAYLGARGAKALL